MGWSWLCGCCRRPMRRDPPLVDEDNNERTALTMAQGPMQKKTQVAKNLEEIHNGSTLIKVRKNGKRYPRVYRMENDFLMFKQINSKKIVPLRKLTGRNYEKEKVWLNEIQDVRMGPYSDTFAKNFDKLGVKEAQCFSVVYGAKHKSLDLIAENTEVAEAWVKGLKHLARKLAQADLITQQEIWMREMFQYADKNKDETLSLKEVISLLKYLNIEVDHDQARQVFEAADTNKEQNAKGEDCLDMDEFITFYQMLTRRPEVEELFQKYNYEGKYLDAQELKDFLEIEQSFEASLEDCEKFIQSFEPCPNVKSQNMMSLDGFNALINSALMNAFDINHTDVYQDMTQPLSHYWIDSSHNTYLTADQLVGPSAVESYIRALKRGCRCVELDCWDGDDEPVIYHGYTLTSKIAFNDVIQAVNEYAFVASDYPLILSIENHCSVEQQRKMAEIMKSTLGEKLLCNKDLDIDKLPSPEDLMNKILVKGKKLPQNKEEDEVSDEDEAADMEDEKVKEDVKKVNKKSKVHLAKELSDCVVICQSVSFKGYEYAELKYNCKQMSSLAEGKAEDLAKGSNQSLIKHNTWQLTRTYPSGIRTDSSNYDPVPLWNAGSQIVALNYQTPDDHMMIYKGRFRDNGGCGYILKPAFLRNQKMENNDWFHSKAKFPSTWRKKLKIQVISGYQLPKKKGDKQKSILDPYVQVDIRGWDGDEQSKRTEHIHNNGFNPVWNETLTFDIQVPELAIVWFRVMDYESYSSNVLVCQYALPFPSLMPGFRTVHLRTKSGDPIFGCALLIKVTFE